MTKQIPPEMIAAGVAEIMRWEPTFEREETIVELIFRAMLKSAGILEWEAFVEQAHADRTFVAWHNGEIKRSADPR